MQKCLKDYFVPHEGNDYAPDSLQKFSVGIMAILIVFSFALANLQALLWISSDWLVSTILPAVIVDLTNEERTDDSLNVVVRNPILDKAAQAKAEDMAKYSYFSHYSPSGVSPWYWFKKSGYTFVNAGENLAVQFTDSDQIVDAWMNSPGHRANILSPNYTEIGIGTAQGEYKGFPTVFVVQFFGAPAEAAAPIATESEVEKSVVAVTDDVVSVEFVSNVDESTRNKVASANIETISLPKEDSVVGFSETKDETDIETRIAEGDELNAKNGSQNSDIVLYSDFATTSRDAIPATTTILSSVGASGSTPIIGRTATQSQTWLQFVYEILGVLVVLSLSMSIIIEWRKQHPIQIVYGTGLLAVMGMLFYIHVAITSGVLII